MVEAAIGGAGCDEVASGWSLLRDAIVLEGWVNGMWDGV